MARSRSQAQRHAFLEQVHPPLSREGGKNYAFVHVRDYQKLLSWLNIHTKREYSRQLPNLRLRHIPFKKETWVKSVQSFGQEWQYHCTVSSVVAFFPLKNQREAIIGPANAAMPWKPWLKLSLAAAYRWLPRTLIYEFAATSRQDSPHPVGMKMI